MKLSLHSDPWLAGLLVLVAIGVGAVADDIPRQHAAQIWEAAPAEAQVTPSGPRRVLIFVTPPHLMEKDPHRGYCIPYGSAAFEAIAAFGGADFRLADEIYESGDPYDRRQLRVLLSLDPARSNMGVRWIRRTDGDFALAWVAPRGNGRIFNTSFGHRTELFWNPRILQFYLDAVQFVTGDLEGPIAPRAERPVRQIPGTEPVPDLPGFGSLFNGRDLAGWEGDSRIWSVRDGIITGQTTEDVRVTENSFLVWKDEIEDFELRLKFRLEGGNSGIYYRARKRPPAQREGEALVGTQADFSADGRWTGVIMEYTLREVLAERGEQVVIDEAGVRRVVGRLGDPTGLLAAVDLAKWNEYVVVARGGRVTTAINGVPMAELDDRDPNRIERGWLGLQVHTGPPMKVEFKDVFLKRL